MCSTLYSLRKEQKREQFARKSKRKYLCLKKYNFLICTTQMPCRHFICFSDSKSQNRKKNFFKENTEATKKKGVSLPLFYFIYIFFAVLYIKQKKFYDIYQHHWTLLQSDNNCSFQLMPSQKLFLIVSQAKIQLGFIILYCACAIHTHDNIKLLSVLYIFFFFVFVFFFTLTTLRIMTTTIVKIIINAKTRRILK